MRKNKYGLILTLALAILGVFAAGCGDSQVVGEENNSLTISVVTKDMYLDMAVEKFKELHPGVNVEVKEYTSNPLPASSGKNNVMVKADDPADIEKYVTAMNTQLMSGQGSDIILLNNLPYETYADKNLLVDLDQMMQEDQSFDRSKYYQNVLEAVKYKGVLYGLPVSFSIDMISADRTLLENSQVEIDDNTWNWDDFVKTAERIINDNNNGGTQELYALAGMDEKRLISSLVRENYSKLVDKEKKTADFTGKEFLDLLNLSKYLIDHKLVNTDTTQAKMADLASRGNLVFNITPLRGFIDLQAAKTTFGGEVQFLKSPGSEGNLSFSTNAMYGISSNSANKELAWEFLKLLVSDEMMSQKMLMGMPLNKSVVPQIAEDLIQSLEKGGVKIAMKGAGDSQTQPITLQPPTQEDIDFVENLLEKANIYNGADQKIISIVQEETTAFFTGQKTAEMTAQLIQDRVSTYLNE
ncbi:MAG: extracellular solute-binding protein [Dehalobacterium sp.]